VVWLISSCSFVMRRTPYVVLLLIFCGTSRDRRIEQYVVFSASAPPVFCSRVPPGRRVQNDGFQTLVHQDNVAGIVAEK